MVADVRHSVTLTFNLDQSELSHFRVKLLIGQLTSRAARQIERVHNLSRSPTRLLFVAFIHKSHSDGQSCSDGQKMKKIHVNKALGPPLTVAGDVS